MSFVKYSCSKTYTKPRRAVKTVCCPTIGSQLKTHSRRAWSRRDCRFVPIFHMNQPVFCNAQVYGKLLLLALHFVSPNFNNSLCNNLLRKTPIFRWQWTWSQVWIRHRLHPTAIRRQPEAVSFVRKTARPGGCAPASPRETSQEGWKKLPHGKPHRKGEKKALTELLQSGLQSWRLPTLPLGVAVPSA